MSLLSLIQFKRSQRIALAALALMLPAAVWADNNGTATLSANTDFAFDSGSMVASGGDIKFTGTTITFQGSATGFSLGPSGSTAYNNLTQSTLAQLGAEFSAATISPLAVNDVFAVHTLGGNYAKALVTAVSGSSITFNYSTYGNTSGGSGGGGGPSISLVQNNYSYILPGAPNYGIAPGSIFIIIGSGMSGAQGATLQASTGSGIPQTLDLTSVSVTVGGTTVNPGLYYVTAGAIAGVLPSNTPVGDGTITVKYNGTPSSPAPIHVIASALGLDTLYGTGYGIGVATDNGTGAVINYNASAKPNQYLDFWGSGLGADTADSDYVFASSPNPVNVPVTVYIGGIPVTPLYSGSSGYPGLDQIVIQVPNNVPSGCNVGVTMVAGGVASNSITLPFEPNGGVCSDPVLGLDGSQLSSLSGKTNINVGVVAIFQSGSGSDQTGTAGADFFKEQGAQTGSGYGEASLGSCIIEQSNNSTFSSGFTQTGLDAGTISVTGPAGTKQLTNLGGGGSGPSGFYGFNDQSGTFILPSGGTYTFTGTGGKDIGAFSASVSYSSPLVWTNMNSLTTITRSQGLTINWTGGAAGTYVNISGSSSTADLYVEFDCNAPVAPGTFTVPAYITTALPAGLGDLSVENSTDYKTFTAPGLDFGLTFAGTSFDISPTYQ